MEDSPPIADRAFDLVNPDGKRVHVVVRFGPIYESDQSFRCPVRFEGWDDSRPEIFGYDSLQAFLLAVTYVNSTLRDFIKRGGRVLYPDTDENMPLEIVSTEDDPRH